MWIGGKEREIHFVELLGAYALDEADLVTHRFQLSQRFVVIEQLDVERREIAVVQHLGHFFAFERGGAHDGHAVGITAAKVMSGKGLGHRTHEGCEISL